MYYSEPCAPALANDFEKERAIHELEKAAGFLKSLSPAQKELKALRAELDDLHIQHQIKQTKDEIRAMRSRLEDRQEPEVVGAAIGAVGTYIHD